MAHITLKNIKNFIIGNTRYLGSKVNVTDTSLVEQVGWRASKCPDCLQVGKCLHGCGCAVPGRWFVDEPCNSDIHIPLMSPEEWTEYKIKHNISFDEEGKIR
jgi:hypothetical protein